MQPPIINEFRGKYRFLSNFSEHPIDLSASGIIYPTAEHAYQAQKTHVVDERKWIAGLRTPGEAKRSGREVTLRPDWEQRKFGIMETVVRCKFHQNPDAREQLVATGGSLLVEGNTWHDQVWGDCGCSEHVYTPGLNALGSVLMWTRLIMKQHYGI